MKYLIPIFLLIVTLSFRSEHSYYSEVHNKIDTVPSGVPQLFGGKFYKFNGYVLTDTFIMNAAGDTNLIPYYPSLKFKASDNRWYGWDRRSWRRFAFFGDTGVQQNLQQVTDVGNKTTDTTIHGGIRTRYILPDTVYEPDFELTVFPDLQGMTHNFPDQLSSMFNWVVNHYQSNNIKGILTLGDLTDDCATYEWQRLDSNFDRIDSINLPYLMTMGNHDFNGGYANPARTSIAYNNYFGVSARMGSKPYFGHAYHDSIENNYIKLNIGSMKLMALSLEFLPRDEVLDWAGRVIDSFPDYKVIVCTHAYITTFGERSVDSSKYSVTQVGFTQSNSGQAMWDKLLRKKKNVIMVLGGHFINTDEENRGYTRRITDLGDNGNIVHQIFINYQRAGNATYVGAYGNVGLGYFMRLRFSPSSGKVYASYYSDFLHQNDPAVDSFSLYYPALEIQNSTTIQGGVYVKKEARFDDTVTIKSIAKYAIPFSGQDNRLVGDTNLNYKSGFVNVPALQVTDTIKQSNTTAINTLLGHTYVGNRTIEGTNYNFFGTATLRSYNESVLSGNPTYTTNFGSWQYLFISNGANINSGNGITNVYNSGVLRIRGNATIAGASNPLGSSRNELLLTKDATTPGSATITGSTNIMFPTTAMTTTFGCTNSGGPLTLNGWYAGSTFRLQINSAAHSIENYADVILGTSLQGNSSTVTNRYGLYILPIKETWVTNGRSIYQAGTSDTNYFAGYTGIGTSSPLFNSDVRGASCVLAPGFSNVQKLLESNLPATMYVVSGAGNYGLTIQRASASSGNGWLTFYKTYNSNPSIPTAGLRADGIGTINWQTVAGNLSIVSAASIRGRIDTVSNSYVSGELLFSTMNNSGSVSERARITSAGNFEISTNPGSNVSGMNTKLWVNGSIAAHKDSAQHLSIITTQNITVWDTVDNKFKRVDPSVLRVGTTTNDSPATGIIGEEINSTVSTYTDYTTSATYQNITSITLTAGDWDLSAFFTYSSNSATITAAANAIFVVSTTTASPSGATEGLNINYIPQAALLGTSKFSDAIPPYRVSLSGTTTYYLNTQASFTIGNPQFVGTIRARRMR